MRQADFTTPERLGVAAILGIALLTFFFPLLVIHVPIAGDQSVSGYDVFSRVTQFQHDAGDSVAPSPADSDPSISSAKPETGGKVKPDVEAIPLSVKVAWTLPMLISGSFLCAALALVSAFKRRSAVAPFGVIGGSCAVLAIVNAVMLSSDLKTWMAQSMKDSLRDNPFAGFGAMMMNSFELRAGTALYVLTLCLFLAAFVTYTRLLSRIQFANA